MAPLSLKIILDDGAITRTLKFDTTTRVREANHIVRDKILTLDLNKEYGFFLSSADNEYSGVWLDDGDKTLEYYMLREGDSLHYLPKVRNMRLRMLDGAVKTLQLDESKKVVELMVYICEKLRISHSEEYGLCREETESTEDSKPATGTLTLKKKTIQREKDAKLEQLSKKLKTDDLVEWLDQHKTLRELKVDPQEMLLFKRRLFYSDRNVDSRDPVQLNLLYVQTRDGILEGKQVVTETKALEFAGLQCQIQFGDYHEEKHKPGFIQNLREFLPEQYVSWGVEKKTIKEHKKLIGVPEIEAKHLYTKMARELPTYGVTFFLVKEKQLKKKKLVPRLIGINAQSILRLDEETKEIIQVWLLTQVKSYRADYESFALNFGDYSEKEYVVKTNEGFRIKDILEGYIDIIKRSLAAPRQVTFTEGEAMYEDNVERLRGTTIQNYSASKIMQSSLVGPSQIISVDQGRQARENTQTIVMNELTKTCLSNTSQHAIISQQAKSQFHKRQLSNGFENTMKHFNSECVKTVVYLSDPTQENIEKAKQIVAFLEDALPGIIHGIKETAAASSPLKSKILLNNLDDLCSYVKNLSYETKNTNLSNEENLIKAQDAAKKAADLSTQMHLSLDPNTKRRSKILMRSRDSFIQDEKTEASLRRASFLAVTDKTWTAVESAARLLDEACERVPSHDEPKELGKRVAYNLGKLQATIAMILNSHADPANIDYESAVMSMNTLSEVMPILVQDIKHILPVGEENNGQDLKKYVKQLLDCTRAICMLTGSDNVNKMYDVGNDYADVCKIITENVTKLIINNQSPEDLDSQNNEIVKLVQNVGSKVQLLLMGTSELTKLEASDPRATELDAAAIKCTDATESLIACARLTLSSIQEPHSKSALTAATENISSSAQNMAILWKSLSEKPNRHSFTKQLANSTFELAKALDKLRNAFSDVKAIDDKYEKPDSNKQLLKFIATAKTAEKIITEANEHLQKISTLPVIHVPKNEDGNEYPGLKSNLSQKLAHLNAAIAGLLQAMGDPNHSDYGKAETAVDIISKLMPDIINDSKYLNGQVDETTWKNIVEDLKDMLETIRDICTNTNESNEEIRNNAAAKYAKACGRLTYIYDPRKNYEKENQIMDLSKSAVDEISQMLTRVNYLVETVDKEEGNLLDNAGVRVVAPAQALLKIAKITAPNINEARCQESLLSAIDHVSDELQNLKHTWTPILESPEHKQSKDQLNNNLEVVNKTLNALREVCTESDDAENQNKQDFTSSMSAANSALENASRELQQLTGSQFLAESDGRNEYPGSGNNLSQKLARLNAAVAALLQASGDPNNSDYGEVKKAVDIISQLTPDIIKDSINLNGQVDETTWSDIVEHLKEMLKATKDICENADESNGENLDGAASRFAHASGRLTYIYNPRKKCEKANQIMDLSKSAVDEISEMRTRVHDLVENMDRENGDLLDKAADKVVGPAQRLLKIAKMTAPNINEVICKKSLLAAIDHVCDEINNLKSTWTPMVQSATCKPVENTLYNSLELVKKSLYRLREACNNNDDDENEKKQEYTMSMSAANSALKEASRELQGITHSRVVIDESRNKHPELRINLSQKLAHLNAAVADLIQATGDSNNSDYGEAKKAMDIISKLTPNMVKDSIDFNGQIDEKTWKNIAEYLKDLLEATRDICANSDESNEETRTDAASKFANASGRLTYIYNPCKKYEKENQIMDLSKSAVDKISQMLTRVNYLVETVDKEEGNLLDNAGVRVVAPAQRLIKIAEITAPNINEARCQESLLAALDHVSDELQNLKHTWTPILESPEYKQSKDQLNNNLEVVTKSLNALREACTEKNEKIEKKLQDSMRIVDICKLEIAKAINELLPEGAEARDDKRKEQLRTTVDNAKKAISVLDKDLKDILEKSPKTKVDDLSLTKQALAQNLGKLNAALASILIASTDPDTRRKISAVEMFSKLLSDVFKDAKLLHSTSTDTQTGNVTSHNMKTIVEAAEEIYDNIQDNPENVDSAVTKLANSAAFLSSICNQRTNTTKENQIQHLSRSAVEQISLLLPHVYHLAKTIGGTESTELDEIGVKVVDGAKQFLKISQITASTIDDPDCQELLLSSVSHLKDLGKDLTNAWEPFVHTPMNREIKNQLDHNLNMVNTTLEKIRNTFLGDDDNLGIQEKLKNLNIWEAKEKIKEAEKLLYQVKNSPDIINQNEGNTEKPVLEQRMQLTQKITQLNEAMALLLQAMLDRRNPDYKTIKASVEVISNLTPDVIEETMAIQVKLDDDSRQSLFEETESVCKASQEICSSVENNSLEELLQGATKYAQASSKLLHITSPHSYPNKERKILELSRNACERTSLLLSRLSRLAGLTDGVEGSRKGTHREGIRGKMAHELEDFGITIADAAHTLLTNAQITAPSINDENCQAVLLSSAAKLLDLSQGLNDVCHPITQNDEAQDIVAQLQRDLTLLNKDIMDLKTACQCTTENDSINLHLQTHIPLSGEIKLETQSQMEIDHLLQGVSETVKNQGDNEETLVIQDTPLRQLALKILESAKKKVKSTLIPQKEKKEFEKFSQDLTAAINTLDVSNGRCINKPLDSRRRQNLEFAIMDLQQICLLSKRRDEHSNIVDLKDYIDDVISVVSEFSKSVDHMHLKPTDQGNEVLEKLRAKCKEIQEHENKLQNPETLEGEEGSIIDNMMRIDQFAKNCGEQVNEMNSLVLKIDSENAKNVLQDKLHYLTESCDLLRFAAKSSISSAASVEFDENIENIERVEKMIENILKTNEELQNLKDNKMPLNPSKHTIQSAQTKLIATILSGNGNNLPKELTRYAVTMQNEIGALNDQIKLKKHLQSLLNLLKLQTSAKSRLIATWQDVENDSMSTNILEELETFSREINPQKAGVKGSTDNIILDTDIRRMLLSDKSSVAGEPEELKRMLRNQIQKINSVIHTIVPSSHKPELLTKSLHMTLEAVEELVAISRGLKGKDLLRNKRVEEDMQEVKIATYNLIKTSETLSQLPIPDSRRKLLEACRSLNEALNKIVRTTCSGSHEYCELQRDLRLLMLLEPHCAVPSEPFAHCAEQMQSQLELINTLRSSEDMSNKCRSQLRHITSAVCNATEFGAQCAYLLSLSDDDKHVAQFGDIDRYRIMKTIDSIQDTCLQIICSGNGEQAKELDIVLNKQINQLQESLDDNSSKIDNDQKKEILKQGEVIQVQFKNLQEALNSSTFREKEAMPRTFMLMNAIKKLTSKIEKLKRPKIDDCPKKKQTAKEVTENIRTLINSTSTMIKKVSCCEDNSVTWENVGGNDVIKAFEAILSCIRKKGAEAGLIELEETEIPAKSFVKTQIDLANIWLTKPASKEDKAVGVKAAESVLELAGKMCEDLSGGEQEELKHVIMETKQLLNDCATKYNSEKASHLRERLHDVRKLCERGAVTRVVESFLYEPQHEIEQLVDEPDEKQRKFLLEKKIAELLAHLARVTKTARFVADTGAAPRQALINTTDQVELLAPALVQATEKRINHLNDQVAIENYQKLLVSYADSLAKIRDLCDRSVDPIDFSRAAGETIHRIKEENRDPQKSVHTSRMIIKLGHRVVDVGMLAPLVRKDAELQRTLADIKRALERQDDVGDVATEILKKTGEVESALGGENIFQKEPDSDQPIYAAALQLHASLRGWSARHNDAVDGAKLLAVLMARLSHYMDTDNKRELIITSKAIVDQSRAIANIATKLATECTDMRIRTNLLQVCERIPTISGQLKMLTTVKSSSLGQQGFAEDKEAMNMLVGNAQNLMISIQEVVRAAESASVKIMSSQRGYRMKWVQRNYY